MLKRHLPRALALLLLLALPVLASAFPWGEWEVTLLKDPWQRAWMRRDIKKDPFVLLGPEKRKPDAFYVALGLGFFSKPFLLTHFPDGKEKKFPFPFPFEVHSRKVSEAPEVDPTGRSLKFWVWATEPKDPKLPFGRLTLQLDPVTWTQGIPGFLLTTELISENVGPLSTRYNAFALLEGAWVDLHLDQKAASMIAPVETLETARMVQGQDGREGFLLQVYHYQGRPEDRVKVGAFYFDPTEKKVVFQQIRKPEEIPTPVVYEEQDEGGVAEQ